MNIINWVVWLLDADWLKAVVYNTVYHGYDPPKNISLFERCNQFLIAKRHLGGFWYIMANIPLLIAVSKHAVLH